MHEQQWRKRLKREPGCVETRLRLGAHLVEQERFQEAERVFAAGVARSPQHPQLLYQHGEALLDLGRVHPAIERFEEVLRLRPDHPDVLASLGGALLRVGRAPEAAEALERAAERLGDDPLVCSLLGDALAACRRIPGALAAYLRTWELGQRTRSIAFFCGNALTDAGHFAAGAEMMRAGLALEGDDAPPLHNLGKALFELGDVTAACDAFRQSWSGGELTSLRNLAVSLPGDPSATVDSIRRVRDEYARRVALECEPWSAPRVHGGPLRVGYVSSFFARASYMRPVSAVLAAHDPQAVVVEVFHDGPSGATPDRLRANAAVNVVHEVAGLSTAELVRLIRERELDVLVDLNGYSAMQRLPLLTVRLARCGIGWFNHYAPSGLTAVDVLVGDAQTIAPGDAVCYGDRLEVLPLSYLAFRFDSPAPVVVEPPCIARGSLTFGSLCSQYKITPEVLSSWSRILASVPGSRLVLANRALAAADVAAHVRRTMESHGVAGDRIELRGGAPHEQYLRNYDDIDIALDAWPYNGGTTTTEAMWQGVPVLTFRGDRWASRTSASLLVDSPFAAFLHDSEDAMLVFAAELGKRTDTPEMLAALRSTARERLVASPVCDTVRLARELERIYASVAAA